MLTRRSAFSTLLYIAMVACVAATPAYADPTAGGDGPIDVDCGLRSCNGTIEAVDPGSGEDLGGSGSEALCQTGYNGEWTSCTGADGSYWSDRGKCWTKPLEVQPPKSDEVWEGHTDGVIISCITEESNGWWEPSAPGTVSPRELAQRAVSQMQIRAPRLGLTGGSGPDRMQVIGLPTWFWAADPGESTTGPATRTATAGAVSVTATATLDRTVWRTGDGGVVTCSGGAAAGTPYDRSYGAAPSPTCGYWYSTTSAGQLNEAFTVTVTAYWTVTWSGGGQSGTIPLTMVRSAQLPVGELQAVVTESHGR